MVAAAAKLDALDELQRTPAGLRDARAQGLIAGIASTDAYLTCVRQGVLSWDYGHGAATGDASFVLLEAVTIGDVSSASIVATTAIRSFELSGSKLLPPALQSSVRYSYPRAPFAPELEAVVAESPRIETFTSAHSSALK